jgi:hypothetical protein
MTTGTLTGNESFGRTTVGRRDKATRLRLGRVGLGTAGVIAVLASAWGGIVPYVGPIFGFSADGTGSWYWSLSHSLLSLVPGAVGVLLGLFVIAESRGVTIGRGRMSLAGAGMLLILCGAWFAIGPHAWPVLRDSGNYFQSATHMRFLTHELGYSVGVGLVLVMCGAFVAGWASRHSPSSAVVGESTMAADSPMDAEAPMATESPQAAEPPRTAESPWVKEGAQDVESRRATEAPRGAAGTVSEPEAGI